MQSIATTFRSRIRGFAPGSLVRLALVAVPALAAAMVAVKMLYVERVVGDNIAVVQKSESG